MHTQFETTLGRAVLALVVGAFLGSVLTLVGTMGPMAVERPEFFGLDAARWEWIVSTIIIVSVGSFFLFSTGLLVVGAPAWWLIHRAGYRNWPHLLMLGVALSIAFSFALEALSSSLPTPDESYRLAQSEYLLTHGRASAVVKLQPEARVWSEMIVEAALTAIAGGLVALVVWRMAYRRVEVA
jgi:hypothetical protein